ncbi:cytochrome-c peroxidase [Spirosoma aureum]|uniref:Cytochrome-c peroxidase n=1 Tax=Spirosoma aureum TaxID=2692134 RepID=A0A6G9ASJ5_9BACT|nr:cytochrome c peroxidase [Spirosoma aureum]QIP15255.1 cytochrome-c peroxidase [Spirosoma aureum]
MISEKNRPVPAHKTAEPNVWWIVALTAGLLLLIGLYGLFRPRPTPLQRVQMQYVSDIALLDSAVRKLQRVIVEKRPVAAWKQAFLEARLRYKRVEFLTELYNPETAKSINGPNLPEVDEADKRVEQPEGLQVLEEFVFHYEPEQHTEAVEQVALLVSNVGRLTKVAATNEMTDSHIFDAMRLDVFRLISLGITGFDSPIARHSLPEAVQVLESLRQHLSFYKLSDKDARLATQLDHIFADAISTLNRGPDFNRFDRLAFITNQANVLSGLLLDAQRALNIPVFQESRFLSAQARTLTDPDAFDGNFFVNSNDDRPTAERVALGKLLFYDPILSGNSKRSCASCHQPERAFTDGEPTSLGMAGSRSKRNAPTLLNASLQAVQFMDSRVVFLEDQASDVIANETEMHGSLPAAVRALQQRNEYRNRFINAYKEGVTEYTVKNALASYIRSLTSLDSRIDRFLRNDAGPNQPAQLTTEEKQGFNLFMGKGQCATCHFFPLFNGTVPPMFAKTESEVLGTPATSANEQLDADVGKFKTTAMDLQKHAFKTPTIRHVAKTAPYMHNGVYQTLEQVVDFYDRGGGNGLGFNLPNQTLPDSKLDLTKKEQAALVAFMKAL